ncbi:hypothetical protein AN964_02780 [Heyndrickxia shackletonii]|uniref:Uncharacterized protein n=1 Tax=Heyndrickxia shackletonii TaxID=157838 RepID=A0A0Q3WV67_9BACI|nr:hypothetical protein AN964_02780 [Heyndrickxia shackletonii]RTZ56785.1 hypothetical protein EKO25_05835 [Bacillus sp. SAJ1]
MFFFLLILIPALGVLWFLNLTNFLIRLKKDQNTHNQKVLGAILTFLLVFAFAYGFLGLIE